MTDDLLDRMREALLVAGAEWEATHGPACDHPLHAIAEPIVLVRDDQQPPIIPCPGCGGERPLAIVQLRRV